jgi:hypothetical protein
MYRKSYGPAGDPRVLVAPGASRLFNPTLQSPAAGALPQGLRLDMPAPGLIRSSSPASFGTAKNGKDVAAAPGRLPEPKDVESARPGSQWWDTGNP